MREQSFTERVSAAIVEYRFEKLPSEVVAMVRNLTIDLIGAGLAGSVQPESRIIHDFAFEAGGKPESTIWGTWRRCGHLNAAMANAYQSHILEMDDVHTTACEHPGVAVIPAAIATAERLHLSGKKVIEAIAAGYETEIRVGEALGTSHYYFWHTTCTGGSFGSAAAVGMLLDLTYDQMADALGNAGSQSGGLWQFLEENAMTKYLHCAKANYNGMLAAELAKRGLTGARMILEGDRGLLKATSATKNPEIFFASCGREYRVLSAGYKPWPSCRHTHTAIEACLRIRKKYAVRVDEVERIQVDTYRTATQVAKNNVDFDDVRAAKFSISYCVAIALVYGEVTVALVNDLVRDRRIRSLVAKTSVSADDDLESYRPDKMPARVTVFMKDMAKYSEIMFLAKGDPSNPLTEAEIDDKYLSLAAPVIGRASAETLLARCRRLDAMDDMADLFEGIAPASQID